MSNINIQITIGDQIHFTKSIKVIDETKITEEDVVDLLSTINTRTIESLIIQDIIASLKTKVSTHLINFVIDGETKQINKLRDVLIYTFEYLINNKYITPFNSKLRLNDIKYIYNVEPKHCNHQNMISSHEYRGFYLDLNIDRSHMKKRFDTLIKHFKINKTTISLQNWPK